MKAFSFVFCTTSDAKSTKGIYRVIVKQRANIEHAHPVYLHAVEKYEKLESVNTQNDQETSKN